MAQGEAPRFQHEITYLNGLGKPVEARLFAGQGAEASSSKWIVSGRVLYNNKGNAAREYEPFFATDHRYDSNSRFGECTINFYDALSRKIGMLRPDHAFEKAIFTPWTVDAWEANDTVLVDPTTDPQLSGIFKRLPTTDYLPSWYDSHVSRRGNDEVAATKAAVHAATPSRNYLDPLSRTFCNVTNNITKLAGEASGTTKTIAVRAVLDIQGYVRQRTDNRGRVTEKVEYDMMGNVVHKFDMDSGPTWILTATGKAPVRVWSGKSLQSRLVYDRLRRPLECYVQAETRAEFMESKTVYGESQPEPEKKNMRSRAVKRYDQAGVIMTNEYDFKGNAKSTTRQLSSTYKTTLDWSVSNELLTESFTTVKAFDAVGRETKVVAPGPATRYAVYNPAGLLQSLSINEGQSGESAPRYIISNAEYDEKGRTRQVTFGNGAVRTFDYDPVSKRLTNMKTTRASSAFPADSPQPQLPGWPGSTVQNISYTYDAVGNTISVVDNSQQAVYFRNERVDPSNDYTFDSINRLVQAKGREKLSDSGVPTPHGQFDSERSGLAHPNDGKAIGTYIETYEYDDVGNIASMHHTGGRADQMTWIRTYSYREKSLLQPEHFSNRLTSTTVQGRTEIYKYEGDGGLSGNMTSMPHFSLMSWDYRDRLRCSSTQVVNNGTAETTWYVYDDTGTRIRKVTENQAQEGATPTIKDERLYMGSFEVYRKYSTLDRNIQSEMQTMTLTTETLGTVAIIETATINDSNGRRPKRLVRFQVSNHISSASLELDDTGQILSYEEYSPFGSTTYQAAGQQTDAPKRYRFNSKERDSESGLCYYGARYLAPWIGQWLSCDPGPAPHSGGNSSSPLKIRQPYSFCDQNPIGQVDLDGREPTNTLLPRQTKWNWGDLRVKGMIDTYEANLTFKFDNGVEMAHQGLQGLGLWAFHNTEFNKITRLSHHALGRFGPNPIGEYPITPFVSAIKFTYNVDFGTDAPNIGSGPGTPDNANSFRHALGVALAVNASTEDGGMFAWSVAMSHETGTWFKSPKPMPLEHQFKELQDIDNSIDIRNNLIGYSIALTMPKSSPKEIAQALVLYGGSLGLWRVEKINGYYMQVRFRLTTKEMVSAMQDLDKLDWQGLNKKEQDEQDKLTEKQNNHDKDYKK